MQFHECETVYSAYRRSLKRGEKPLDVLEFYTSYVQPRIKGGAQLGELPTYVAEARWLTNDRPYYRIYPDYVDVFSRTTFDVPLKFFKTPYTQFAVRFAKGCEPTWDNKGRKCMAQSFLFHHSTALDDIRVLVNQPDLSPNNSEEAERVNITLTVAFIYQDDQSELKAKYLAVGYDKARDAGLILQQILNRANVTKQALYFFSIALSICYLATGGDKLIEPDVLNRDFDSYLKAVNTRDHDAVNRMHKQATVSRGGSLGYVIGRAESLLGRRSEYRRDGESQEGGGNGLHYSHQRKAHFRKRWTKEGDLWIEGGDPIFVRQCTVRPDLPPHPIAKGSHTLDSKKQEDEILGTNQD
jgi:hypothetical protein